jgi:hypothetical protein
MEEGTRGNTTRDERRSLGLSALIMSIAALLCAFMLSWRIFSIAMAGVAFIVSIFVLTKVRHKGPSKTMSLLALVISLIAAAASCYFLTEIRREEQREEIPSELRDSLSTDENTLDRLRNSMDTTQPAH